MRNIGIVCPPGTPRASGGVTNIAALVFGWAMLLAPLLPAPFLAGCTKAGRSALRAKVTVDSSLLNLAKIELVVQHASGAPIRRHLFESAVAPADGFGLLLDADIDETVLVYANGFDGATPPAGIAVSEAEHVRITPGQVSTVTLLLGPGMPDRPAPGGSGGTGGAGSGGTGGGGNSGTGGAGATGLSTGGSSGSGGLAGGPGSGGSLIGPGGAGGLAGTGGRAATGGSAGTGATAGQGGQVGTGGAIGSGGAAGAPGRTWRGAQDAGHASVLDDHLPHVAVDALGNVVVIYVHGSSIFANRYSASTGMWGTPTAVDGRPSGAAANPSVAVDKNGQWLAVWEQGYANPLHGIWQSTSADGVAWSAPAAISATGTLLNPVLGMNRDGVAAVAWTENVANKFTVNASMRVAGTWTAPRVLRPGPDNGDRFPAVAVSGNGDAFVTFEQTDGGAADKLSVWMARYATAGGWTPATLLEAYDGGNSFSSGVAANGAGQVVFTWIQYTTATAEMWARRMTADGTLAAPVRVGEGVDVASVPPPAVTLDESGTATVAWAFAVRTKFNVFTARAPWAGAWSAPLAMETDNAAADDQLNLLEWAPFPAVGSDLAGNVVLTWRKRVGARFDLWGQRLAAGATTWGAPTLLETRDSSSVVFPHLAVGAGGVAAVAWIHFAEFEIWANILR